MILRRLLLSIVILNLLVFTPPAQAGETARVAVLPFEIYSDVRSTALQAIISKDLSMYIAKEEQVAVVDHQTIATLLDKSSPGFNKPALLSIAEKLEADFLVLGSITKIGENISLDTYLLNTRGTPSFSKDFTEGKNLTVLLNKMGTKISSQVLEVTRSYQELQETEEQIVFKKPEETKPVEPAAVAGSELPEFETREEEDLEAPAVVYTETDQLEPAAPVQAPDSEAADDQPSETPAIAESGEEFIEEIPQEAPPLAVPEEEVVEAPEVVYAEIDQLESAAPVQALDSEAGDDQPSETPAIAESGEEFIEEIPQEAPPLAVPEEEVVEAPEVVYAEIDQLESAAPVQALDSEAGDDQPSETPAIAESGEEFIEEIPQEAPPLAVPEEDRPETVVWPETEDEGDKAATVALLPKTEREEMNRAEQKPADKSFSSPFSTVKPVKITSKSMEADNKRNLVTFKGNVIVKQEDIVISSDLMKVSYEPKGGINKVEASGNVKMSQENRIATGKKLIFFNPEQKIVMTGKPKIWQGDNLISCEKVTVLLEEDKIYFEGKVDSIIYPRSMQEEPKENKQQVEEITTPGREAGAVVEQEGYSPEE